MKQFWEEVPGGRFRKADLNEVTTGVPAGENAAFDWGTGKSVHASYELHYYGFMQPGYMYFDLPAETPYRITVIDTYNMTMEERGSHTGRTRVELPGRQWMAVRLVRE